MDLQAPGRAPMPTSAPASLRLSASSCSIELPVRLQLLTAHSRSILAASSHLPASQSCSKTRTWTKSEPPKDVSELPVWNFDGSSTGQAPGHDSEVLLKPVRIFPDPFRGAPHLIVLCECMLPDMTPHPGNTRVHAKAIFDKKLDEEPWFGALDAAHSCSRAHELQLHLQLCGHDVMMTLVHCTKRIQPLAAAVSACPLLPSRCCTLTSIHASSL